MSKAGRASRVRGVALITVLLIAILISALAVAVMLPPADVAEI